MLLLAVAVVVAFAVIAYRRSVREYAEQAALGSDPDDSRAEFLATLKRTSREIGDDLRAREASMRALLREADERIAILTELLAVSELASPDCRRPTHAQPSVSRPVNRSHRGASHDNGRGEVASEADLSGRSGVHDRIRMLAQEGKRPEEIAKQLGMGTGEVVLVLGLANRH